jgi:hypothetical protein
VIWVLVAAAAVVVVVIGFVAVGRETGMLAGRARPAVFDVTEAVEFIADRLPADVAGRLSHDDVRWVLRTDVDVLESATAEGVGDDVDDEVVDEDDAVARILARADEDGRDIVDEDVVAVLDARLAYLEAIGAIGPEVHRPGERDR